MPWGGLVVWGRAAAGSWAQAGIAALLQIPGAEEKARQAGTKVCEETSRALHKIACLSIKDE